jgi:N-acetylmuramoyl-L-alanine amidase
MTRRPHGPRLPECCRVALIMAMSAGLAGCGSGPRTGTPTTVVLTPSATTVATAPRPVKPPPVHPKRPPPHPSTVAFAKPTTVWNPIDFGPQRKAEMAAYVSRHYGSFMSPTWRLSDPRVIVIHFTDTPDFSSTYNTVASDTADSELHELPGTCAHFVVDGNGVIHQLVALSVMCRHTVGLNWTAIGIEHVGSSDQQVLNDSQQTSASLQLVRWLRCRFNISIENVIGHNESLSSPYHREDVAALRTQTHDDFKHADMQTYRSRLAALGGCPA